MKTIDNQYKSWGVAVKTLQRLSEIGLPLNCDGNSKKKYSFSDILLIVVSVVACFLLV